MQVRPDRHQQNLAGWSMSMYSIMKLVHSGKDPVWTPSRLRLRSFSCHVQLLWKKKGVYLTVAAGCSGDGRRLIHPGMPDRMERLCMIFSRELVPSMRKIKVPFRILS